MGAETFLRDTGTDSVMYYAFDTTEDANAAMEFFLQDYTENVKPQFDYESKATYAGEFESTRSMFLLLGVAMSFIVGLVGVLNLSLIHISSSRSWISWPRPVHSRYCSWVRFITAALDSSTSLSPYLARISAP